VEPSAADVSEAGPAQLALERVTTYLTKNLVAQRAAEKRTESKGPGLVPLHVHSEGCLFVPAFESAALISLERIDSLEQMDSGFQWTDGRQNVYGYKSDQELLHLQPDNPDVRPERLDRERWISRWREADSAFGEVSFAVVPAGRRLDGVKPSDFEIRSIM